MNESQLLTEEDISTDQSDKIYQLASTTHFPSPTTDTLNSISDEAKITAIESKFSEIMQILGLDLEDPSIIETPYRVAKMFVKEIFHGLKESNFPSLSFFEDQYKYNTGNIVLVKDIEVQSFCEHHFLPIIGKAHVAYIPQGKLLGLSKINRIVDYFCRRPQLQERLNAQIADSLSIALNTQHVAVSIEAHHCCVSFRGIKDRKSVTSTEVLLGDFQNNKDIREQFFNKIKE